MIKRKYTYELGQKFVAKDGTIATLLSIPYRGRCNVEFDNGAIKEIGIGNLHSGQFTLAGKPSVFEDRIEVESSCGDIVIIDPVFSYLIPQSGRFMVEELRGYKRVRLKTKTLRGEHLSRVLSSIVLKMDMPDGLQVDHINRSPLDNRLSNLRVVTNRINTNNRGIPKCLYEKQLKSGDKSYSLSLGFDDDTGGTYSFTTPLIKNKEVVEAAKPWFISLFRQRHCFEKEDFDLEYSENMFRRLFEIAADESKSRRPQDVAVSYDAWMARADFAISLSRELYAKDAELIKSVTGYALGTTLQEIYDVR